MRCRVAVWRLGTSRLYVLGLAFLVAGHSSFWLIGAMSLLILAWAGPYAQICRIYPDGGGVYTAARHRSRLLGVIGALLLIAITLSPPPRAPSTHSIILASASSRRRKARLCDAGDKIIVHPKGDEKPNPLELRSPGLWAIVAIGHRRAESAWPEHTAGGAVFAAVGMVLITLLLVVCAVPQIPWRHLPSGDILNPRGHWEGFVAIVLALSGVEAIANLTGVMTSRSIARPRAGSGSWRWR